jgi:hypothetical protein
VSDAQRYVRNVSPDRPNTEKDHFYPTPPQATQSLLALEELPQWIWEPACGDGAISKVLLERGHSVVSADLVDRGYGEVGHDFLMERTLRAPAIVTNPPFKLAEQFVEHAIELGAEKVCMLLRLAWLEGVTRKALFRRTNLSRVWVSSRRLSFARGGTDTGAGGSGMVAFAWFVWEKGPPFATSLFFFDWMDHAPECAKVKVRAAAEPMPMFD